MIAPKILYDWVEHGRNRAKRENDDYDKELAKSCRECGGSDSQFHTITECITDKLTSIRMETDARIDLYIRGVEEKGESIYFQNCLKEMIHGSIRSDKLRLGMWELRDAEKLASIDIIKRGSDSEINKIRTELVNMNAIYFTGCRKLINEKQKMDWRERNPNTIGKKRNKKKSSIASRKEVRISRKKRNVNDVLKNSDDITEAEMKKKSDKTEKKRKEYMRDAQEKKEENGMNNGERKEDKCKKEIGNKPKKRKDRARSRTSEDNDCSMQENNSEGAEKKLRLVIGREDQEREDNRKKRRWNTIKRKGEVSMKEKKRRRTTTEDIRVFFGTEDSH